MLLLTGPDMPLFTESEPLYLSFSLFPHKTPYSTSVHYNRLLAGAASTGWAFVLSLEPWVDSPRPVYGSLCLTQVAVMLA